MWEPNLIGSQHRSWANGCAPTRSPVRRARWPARATRHKPSPGSSNRSTVSSPEYDYAIAAVVAAHPDAHILASFPGAGPVTTAVLLAEIGEDRARYPRPQVLLAEAGLAPVTRSSGRSRTVVSGQRFVQGHYRAAVDRTLLGAGRAEGATSRHGQSGESGRQREGAVVLHESTLRWIPLKVGRRGRWAATLSDRRQGPPSQHRPPAGAVLNLARIWHEAKIRAAPGCIFAAQEPFHNGGRYWDRTCITSLQDALGSLSGGSLEAWVTA